MLLLDQTEDTSNSKRAQDGAEDRNRFTNASPLKTENDNSEDYDGEIEEIPAVTEVQFALGNDLNDRFNGEDGHKGVVDDLDGEFEIFRLHVPVESEHKGVSHDTDHDEHVKGGCFSQNDALVSKPAVPGLELSLRLHFQGHELDSDPSSLRALQGGIATEECTLVVESLNDDTGKELEEEHANDDDEHHRVGDHKDVGVLFRLIVWVNSINRVPHDVDPTLSSLNGDQGEKTGECRIEV